MSGKNPSSTHERCAAVRDRINDPRRRYLLLQSLPLWFQVCACLDTIEDVELALEAYLAGDSGTSLGARYLAVYGLLQAIFLQQDAIQNLAKALKVKSRLDDYPRLREIREVRNDIAGHPTRRDQDMKRPTPSFHSIARHSIGGSLEILSQYGDGKTEFRNISLQSLVLDQRTYVPAMLQKVIAVLDTQEEEHKKRFRMEPLADLFKKQLSYALGKIHEAIRTPRTPPLGGWGIEHVALVRESFKDALLRRGIELETYDAIKYHYDLLDYPILELKRYFDDAAVSEITRPEMADIFASFVAAEMKELQGLAEELDQGYAVPASK